METRQLILKFCKLLNIYILVLIISFQLCFFCFIFLFGKQNVNLYSTLRMLPFFKSFTDSFFGLIVVINFLSYIGQKTCSEGTL